MARTAVLGLPRIGPNRELKFALEAFWAGRADGQSGGVAGFKPVRLPSPARGDAAAMRAGFTAKPF